MNDLERPVGTYLLGRRTYEVLVVRETMPTGPDRPAVMRDYAGVWRAAEKIVHSTMLQDVASARTRIERTFDPDAVRRMKEAADADLSVSGPSLGAEALRAGLVDEVQLFVSPVVVGGGHRCLPRRPPPRPAPPQRAAIRERGRLPALREALSRTSRAHAT